MLPRISGGHVDCGAAPRHPENHQLHSTFGGGEVRWIIPAVKGRFARARVLSFSHIRMAAAASLLLRQSKQRGSGTGTGAFRTADTRGRGRILKSSTNRRFISHQIRLSAMKSLPVIAASLSGLFAPPPGLHAQETLGIRPAVELRLPASSPFRGFQIESSADMKTWAGLGPVAAGDGPLQPARPCALCSLPSCRTPLRHGGSEPRRVSETAHSPSGQRGLRPWLERSGPALGRRREGPHPQRLQHALAYNRMACPGA
ncbi:MAG: hypothetical protein JWM59_1284 [Verrucomicrobiales bacterium]|nr:hypothetical protein [Verrucomicrobiales bacterium]